jgi:heme oxygenase (biliverdin-IX-beta and delta-forming)
MENPTAIQTVTDKLRAETAKLHTQLEELPISQSIISPDITKEQYAEYLLRMHDVVKDTEENIIPVISDIVTDFETRKKTQYIQDDLKYIGKNFSENKFPLSESRTFTPAFALGIYYVVEGSSLGGRVILKNIKPALDLDENGGARYFAGYGASTGSTWRNFIMMMEAYATKTNSADDIVSGANYAFGAIKKHLEENLAQ